MAERLFDWDIRAGDQKAVWPLLERMEREALAYYNSPARKDDRAARSSRGEKIMVRISREEAQAIVDAQDDWVLGRVLTIGSIRIGDWNGAKSNLFWWQACMDRLSGGAIWSFLLDKYVRRGWPLEEEVGKLRRADGSIYPIQRPSEIMQKLVPWVEGLSEAETLKLLGALEIGGHSALVHLVAAKTRCLSGEVLGEMARRGELLGRIINKNENLDENSTAWIWRHIYEKMDQGREFYHNEEGRLAGKRGYDLQKKGWMPPIDIEERFMSWIIDGKSWALMDEAGIEYNNTMAISYVTDPRVKRSSEELEKILERVGDSETAWPYILRHGALDIATVEKIAEAARAEKVKAASLLIHDMVTSERLLKSAVVRKFVADFCERRAMKYVISRTPVLYRNEIVSRWVEKDPSGGVLWMKGAKAEDLEGISQISLRGALMSAYRDDRVQAIKIGAKLTTRARASL